MKLKMFLGTKYHIEVKTMTKANGNGRDQAFFKTVLHR